MIYLFQVPGLFSPVGLASLPPPCLLPLSTVSKRTLGFLCTTCIMPWTELLSSARSTHRKGMWGFANEEAHNQKRKRFIIKLQ